MRLVLTSDTWRILLRMTCCCLSERNAVKRGSHRFLFFCPLLLLFTGRCFQAVDPHVAPTVLLRMTTCHSERSETKGGNHPFCHYERNALRSSRRNPSRIPPQDDILLSFRAKCSEAWESCRFFVFNYKDVSAHITLRKTVAPRYFPRRNLLQLSV